MRLEEIHGIIEGNPNTVFTYESYERSKNVNVRVHPYFYIVGVVGNNTLSISQLPKNEQRLGSFPSVNIDYSRIKNSLNAIEPENFVEIPRGDLSSEMARMQGEGDVVRAKFYWEKRVGEEFEINPVGYYYGILKGPISKKFRLCLSFFENKGELEREVSRGKHIDINAIYAFDVLRDKGLTLEKLVKR